jgi:hypothetical protein
VPFCGWLNLFKNKISRFISGIVQLLHGVITVIVKMKYRLFVIVSLILIHYWTLGYMWVKQIKIKFNLCNIYCRELYKQFFSLLCITSLKVMGPITPGHNEFLFPVNKALRNAVYSVFTVFLPSLKIMYTVNCLWMWK